MEDVAATSGNFVFEGDGDDVPEEEDDGNAEAGPSTGNNLTNDAQEEDGGEQGEGEGEGEGEEGEGPEDDYNAAWEVLDVARTIYSKIVEDLPEGQGREERLCLADCYLSLGDVSLETGGLTFSGPLIVFTDGQKTSLRQHKITIRH